MGVVGCTFTAQGVAASRMGMSCTDRVQDEIEVSPVSCGGESAKEGRRDGNSCGFLHVF
jgi:hypothetical protein